ncbi:MAG: proton extrusion protein PcxA [Cyanobacteria bacterium REEB459]|nr:proton extrusion protein PcxA [Cyanobacteria bacterium REEB459]
MQTPGLFRNAQQWFFRTPDRALSQAYEAAQMIEAIEREYFGGNPISSRYGSYGDSAMVYFQSELKKYLNLMRVRLAEFRASRTIIRASDPRFMEVQLPADRADELAINVVDRQAIFFRQLRLIDQVLERYQSLESPGDRLIDMGEASPQTLDTSLAPMTSQPPNPRFKPSALSRGQQRSEQASSNSVESVADRVNVLPRSILRTVDRIRRDLDPEAEQEVVQDFRRSKGKTTGAIRFLLLLIIVPLLTQQFSKALVVGPIVDRVRAESPEIFLNVEMEEEALEELRHFEEHLNFQSFLGQGPQLSAEVKEEKLRLKADEIQEDYRSRSKDAIKNVFADMLAALALALLLIYRKQDIANLKSFIDEIVYGLSDSAKAFLIILFTDTFVGFHSPHGWEVLLEGLSRHLGLPASRDFIFLFIATFPVVLDTVFKYWIFRYLNRISPSAVATYKEMNE